MNPQERLSTADLAARGPERPAEENARAAEAPREPRPGALFDGGEAQRFRDRWRDLQGSFVDEPRRTVEQADALVAEVMQRLAQVFSEERGQLEHQWDRDGDVSTEDLRVGMQRYRSFFDRLLSV